MDLKRKLLSFDFSLLLLVLGLTVFGIIIIGSATKINVNGTGGEYSSQIIWACVGVVLLIITAFTDYKFIAKFYIFLYILNIILLILVLVIGKERAGVKRWIFGIQPSEFSKIFIIIFLSKFIDKLHEKVNNIGVLLFIVLSAAVPILLIKEQPSLSASLVLAAILVCLLFMGNISWKYIVVVLAIVIPIFVILYADLMSDEHKILKIFLNDYQIERLIPVVKPDISSQNYYQTRNSIWAIGSGQLRGKGLYKGTINQLSYLPESHNDFIFSVVGEEFGFLGCIGVLAVMFAIIAKCIFTAFKADDLTGRLMACGVATMLAFQTFVNIGVSTGLLPNTGMPLPFMSYGGSSMWVDMISIGLVLSIGMSRKPKSMF
ncbi:MAG: rod shape-determining protein RodA [Firmicutes bacterium]|nr:rod shape-determining protein RodA [Bacillota bacterium]